MKKGFMCLAVMASLLNPLMLFAQQEADSILLEMMNLKASEDPSELQKILNAKVGASSKKALSSRETPGIVTIITAEEIMLSGARDLIDVFRLVPGLDLGGDIELLTGIGVRGNWSLEGKVLMLIDGIEQNETLYQNIVIGNRYPVDQIARIEVIRGPGSTNYGGSAAYGVVNIITKAASGEEGVYASARYGILKESYARRNVGVSAVKNVGKLRTDLAVFAGQHRKTEKDYFTYGAKQALKDSSTQNPTYANLGLKLGNTEFRGIYEKYYINNPYYEVSFSGFYASLKHNFIFDKLSITPSFVFSQQVPWKYSKTYIFEPYNFDFTTKRYKANITAVYNPTRRISLTAGIEYFLDEGIDKLEEPYFGAAFYSYYNFSLFTEAILQHRIVNITAGLRVDNHSAFDVVVVPRLGLTKRIDNLHFKALLSGAYRAPSIANMATNAGIEPESSMVAELETGYQFTPKMLFTANLFYIDTKNTIVYSLIDIDTESVINEGRVGTSGLELEYRYKSAFWSLTTNYSYYKTNPQNTGTSYAVPGNANLNMAFPAHKITNSISFNLTDKISASANFVFGSKRFAYVDYIYHEDGSNTPVLGELDPYLLANLNFKYNNILNSGLFVGFSVHDLTDTYTPFVQPYDAEYTPIPSGGREIAIQLGYQLDFKKTK